MNEKFEGIIKSGLRSIAASVPIVATIAQGWNEYETKKQSQRVEDFFKYFEVELKRLSDDLKKVKDYIRGAEETPALLEKAIEIVKKESQKEKRQVFARLLSSLYALGNEENYDFKMSSLEALDSLTNQDLKVLYIFSSGNVFRVAELININDLVPGKNKEERLSHLIVSLSKLEARGIVSQTTRRTDIQVSAYWGQYDHWANKWMDKYYELIPFGEKIVRILSDKK